jgi:uncharacterized membrane protein
MQALFFAKLYVLTVPVFFIIDLLWLGVIAKHFYRDNLAHLLSPTVNWPAALSFYLIYIAGILYFAVAPALAQDSLSRAVLNGALFGFLWFNVHPAMLLDPLPLLHSKQAATKLYKSFSPPSFKLTI